MYMLEFSERNAIPLEEINVIGHRFSHDYKRPEEQRPEPTPNPPLPPSVNPYEFNNNPQPGPNNFEPYGGPGPQNPPGTTPFGGNQQVGSPYIQGPGGYGPYGGGPQQGGGYGGQAPGYGGPPGPDFYAPVDIKARGNENNPKSSITNINDIDYYPEVDPNMQVFNKGTFVDPSFDEICDRLRKGL